MAERRIEYMPLAEIMRAPRNPKRHDRPGIRRAIGRFGFVEVPILDERTGRLVAGHGRLTDLEERHKAGDPAPEGVQVGKSGEWLVPVGRGWSSRDDAEAEAYLLTSNKLSELGGWDETELDEMLASIARDDFELAQATGFSAAELERLLDEPDVPDDGAAAPRVPEEVIEHAAVPATAARYAETDEEEAARREQVGNWQARSAAGLVEMILVYPVDDRDEAARLIAAAREILGSELKGSEIVLRALRTMMAVLDNRHSLTPVRLDSIAKHAGWLAEADADA